MSVIVKGAGLDVINPQNARDVSPKDYITAHLMSVTTREYRRTMYGNMLADGLRYKNDKLAHNGLVGVLTHIWKMRETEAESGEGLLEAPWNEEKWRELFSQAGKVIEVFKYVVSSTSFYIDNTSVQARDWDDRRLVVVLPITWKLIISETSSMLRKEKVLNKKNQPSPENIEAFKFFSDLGTEKFLDEVIRSAKIEHPRCRILLHSHLRDEVLTSLRGTVNLMELDWVIFWLKNYGETMPKDFLNIFRVEYARKGGALNL